MGHQRQIVGMGLAEADAGIEADPRLLDAGGEERVAPRCEPLVDLLNDIAVARIDLHRGGGALHVHRTDAGPRSDGQRQHGRIPFEPGDVVDDLGAALEGVLGHGGF